MAFGKGVNNNSSFVAAQFSIPYVVAVCLADGELGPGQLTEKRISDPALIALARKISVHTDEDLNNSYPDKTSSRVEIKLKDGTRRTHQVDIPKGDPRDPLTADDLARKVRQFAGDRDQARISEIVNKILDLENIDYIGEITAMI